MSQDQAEAPAKVILSVEDFRAVFTSPKNAFLLCYEASKDHVSAEHLSRFQQCVRASAAEHQAHVAVYLWECSSSAFMAAKEQLQKQQGTPLLLIVYRGTIADTLRGLSVPKLCAGEVQRVCKRLASFQNTARAATVVLSSSSSPPATATNSEQRATEASTVGSAGTPSIGATMRVDVAKMVGLGKKMLSEGQSVYAEKFFVKALKVLDEMRPDVYAATSTFAVDAEEYEGSVAMCLAWAGLAQIVQGKLVTSNEFLKRLEREEKYAHFRTEPLSEASRACTVHALMLAAPGVWSGETCSQKKLSAQLQAHPEDHNVRSLLVITLFLSGDLERCMTEAVKLKVLGEDFGRVALKRIVNFLGEDHELVKRLGPLTASSDVQ